MKKHFFFLLLFIIILLGCTQDQVVTNGGVMIKSKGLNIINLTSTFDSLRIQESTVINLKLRNAGDFSANDVKAVLYSYGLLIKSDLKNETEAVLPGMEEVLTWNLKAPVELSQTEVTSYPVSTRVYYWYNFSGFQQIAFIPSDFVGDAPTVYSSTSRGPLSVAVQAASPLRCFPNEQGINFTVTIKVVNDESGQVNYYNDTTGRAYHLNELRIKVPRNWTPLDDLSAWDNSTINGETEYKLNFKELQEKFYSDIYDCPQEEPCKANQSVAWKPCSEGQCCCNCSFTDVTECLLINSAVSNLWLIRGEEARVILSFHHNNVNETTIDIVEVNGDYGYVIDTTDFTGPKIITVRGD